jgi:hypothetical protein
MTSAQTVDRLQRLLPQFLTRAEVAALLRRSPGTLANWASQRGPDCFRLEDGQVLSSVEQLTAWLKKQEVKAVAP